MDTGEGETVVYRIFPDAVDFVESVPVKEQLEQLKARCSSIVYPYAGEYIWQHEPFNLRVCTSVSDCVSRKGPNGKKLVEESENDISLREFSSEDTFVPHLFGKVRFGDNLEDEWLVVYFMLEISRQIPRLSITIRDNDGEFLLIEAAYSIPRWLKSENSHNRVFIRDGGVHVLLPAASASRPLNDVAAETLKGALHMLSNGVVDRKASAKIQDAIRERLKGYPDKALKDMHRARCRVPLRVAHILKLEPQLISLAVESFYHRDPDALKATSRMKKFCPEGGAEIVDSVVRMSRAMYAQLIQQVFGAPRCYPMPAANSPQYVFKEAELGMKITCGFEMMYWERSSYEAVSTIVDNEDAFRSSAEDVRFTESGGGFQNLDEIGDSSITHLQQQESNKKLENIPTTDVGWQSFKASLDNTGYFRGLLEGSKGYRELLQAAVVQYRSTKLFANVSAAMRVPVKRIDELLALPHSSSDFSGVSSEEGDNDSWMYDGEDDLTRVLVERQKEMDAYEAKHAIKAAAKTSFESEKGQQDGVESFHAAEVVRSMQSFVNKVSSFEGAELPGKGPGKHIVDDDTVSLDINRLVKELESVFDPKEIESMLLQGVSDDSDMSSDLDLDEDSSDSEQEYADDERTPLENTNSNSKALPPTKRNEEYHVQVIGHREDTSFSDEYSNVMEKELMQSSSLAKSFLQKKEVAIKSEGKAVAPLDGESKVSKLPDKAELDPEEEGEDGPESDDADDLVDVDVNLVESLLRSFMFQQGMPGPATNLLGAMGVNLPDNADTRPGSSKIPKK